MPPLHLDIAEQRFSLRSTFTISRGSRTEAAVLTATLSDQETNLRGRGECVPYAHYGETTESVIEQMESMRKTLETGLDRDSLLHRLPAGAARNAIDAALWDLELKKARENGSEPWCGSQEPVRTMRTLSLATPEAMAAEAESVAALFTTLKLKLGGEPGNLDLNRVAAVSAAAPDCKLVVDANESWNPTDAERRMRELVQYPVVLIEQPLPASDDDILGTFEHPIQVCADESFHTAADVERCVGRYDVVNLKLDKTGGLTHGLEAKRRAQDQGLGLMVGCMVGSSLAMAPALLLAQGVELVDLDGPFLLAEDREPPLELSKDGWIGPNSACWG